MTSKGDLPLDGSRSSSPRPPSPVSVSVDGVMATPVTLSAVGQDVDPWRNGEARPPAEWTRIPVGIDTLTAIEREKAVPRSVSILVRGAAATAWAWSGRISA